MVEPVTAAILASVLASGATAAGSHIGKKKDNKKAKRRDERETKYRVKEGKRETRAHLLGDQMNRLAELEGQRLSSNEKLTKRKAHSRMETADLVREAFSI